MKIAFCTGKKYYSPTVADGKTHSLLRLVDRLYTVIHKNRTKVLPFAKVGE